MAAKKKKATKKAEVKPTLTPAAKKKQEALAKDWNQHREKRRSVFMQKICEANARETGQENTWVCSPDARVHVGLPLPSFCWEFLLDSRIFPLSFLIQIVGKYGTGKSSLFFEFVRWFHQYGGGGFAAENEGKISITLLNSILDYVEDALVISRTDTVEEWQRLMFRSRKLAAAEMEGTPKEPGPGRVMPILFGVDSVVGKLSEETNKTIDDEEAAGRSHPVEAMKVSKFLKRFTSHLKNWPFCLVMVNQLDIRSTSTGALEKHVGGGKQLGFLSSIMLEMKHEGHYRRVNEKGLTVRINCMKNSLGESQRSMVATLKWAKYRDEWVDSSGKERAGVRQRTYWDWHEASVELLLALRGSSAATKNFIENEIGLRQGKQGKVWCSRLGHKSDKDSISYSEAGEAIARDQDLMNDLRDHFGIQPGFLFQPGMDYVEQVRSATKISVEKEAERTRELLEEGGMEEGVAAARAGYEDLDTGGIRTRAVKSSKKKAAKKKGKKSSKKKSEKGGHTGRKFDPAE